MDEGPKDPLTPAGRDLGTSTDHDLIATQMATWGASSAAAGLTRPRAATMPGSIDEPIRGAEVTQQLPRRSSAAGVRWALATAIWPWVVSRLLVGVALALAHEVTSGTHPSHAVAVRVRQGLLGWDAGWYESIAREGYWGAGHQSLRFFPLFPLLARFLSFLPGLSVGAALVVVANLSALLGVAWLAALARRETQDPRFARRAAWLMCLAPPAFTMVMGYAEGTLLLLSVGTFWALRTKRWWAAAAMGFLAATSRPIGVLLVVPALTEALRDWQDESRSERAGRLAALCAPALGLAAFLGWVGWRYRSALAPLKVQEEGIHRGALANPLSTLAHDASLLAHGHHLGTGLHLPWVLLSLALLVVALLRLPLSYGLFAAAVIAVSLTTANLDGFERYALSAFPLVLAAAALTRSGRVERTVLVLAGAGLVSYAFLAFMNLYVP